MYVFWVMLGLLVLYIIRTLMGPNRWDRLLGLSLISTKIIVIIIVIASVQDMSFLLDFAIIYALSGFIGTIFLAIFMSRGRLSRKRGKK